MSHHSQEPHQIEALRALFEKEGHKLGATGEFPEGKLDPSDAGEILFAVAADGGKVIVDFGETPIAWLGMPAETARALAELLRKHADTAELQAER